MSITTSACPSPRRPYGNRLGTPGLLTGAEAIARLGCSRYGLQRLVFTGQVGIVFPIGRPPRYRESDVERLVAASREQQTK
jgi:hypothetical protein